jgi:hypothetical protein
MDADLGNKRDLIQGLAELDPPENRLGGSLALPRILIGEWWTGARLPWATYMSP